jgi:predicted ester cyclase
LRTAFPDIQITDEDILAEGDRVAIRWYFRGTHLGDFLGIPPTGRPVEMGGFDIFRVADGKIQELWLENDYLMLMSKLGVIPGAS